MAADSPAPARFVGPEAWELWREVRLRALWADPDAFGSTYAREAGFAERDFRRRMGADNPCVLAFHGSTPVALGGGFEDLPGWLHVVAMWVEPAWRGRGVGRSVLELLAGWAAEHGLRAHLDVTVGNEAARHLYERAGFVATGQTSPLRMGSQTRTARMILSAPTEP